MSRERIIRPETPEARRARYLREKGAGGKKPPTASVGRTVLIGGKASPPDSRLTHAGEAQHASEGGADPGDRKAAEGPQNLRVSVPPSTKATLPWISGTRTCARCRGPIRETPAGSRVERSCAACGWRLRWCPVGRGWEDVE